MPGRPPVAALRGSVGYLKGGSPFPFWEILMGSLKKKYLPLLLSSLSWLAKKALKSMAGEIKLHYVVHQWLPCIIIYHHTDKKEVQNGSLGE